MKNKLILLILIPLVVYIMLTVIFVSLSSQDNFDSYLSICDFRILEKNATSAKLEALRCVGEDGEGIRYFDDIVQSNSVLMARYDYNETLENVVVGGIYRIYGEEISGKVFVPRKIIFQEGDLLTAFKKTRGYQ